MGRGSFGSLPKPLALSDHGSFSILEPWFLPATFVKASHVARWLLTLRLQLACIGKHEGCFSSHRPAPLSSPLSSIHKESHTVVYYDVMLPFAGVKEYCTYVGVACSFAKVVLRGSVIFIRSRVTPAYHSRGSVGRPWSFVIWRHHVQIPGPASFSSPT